MFLYVHKNSKTHDEQRNKFFQIEFLCIFSGDRIFSGVYFYNFLPSMIYHMLDGIQRVIDLHILGWWDKFFIRFILINTWLRLFLEYVI